MAKGNTFEPDGHGASDRTLLLGSIAFLVFAGLFTMSMLIKSTGRLDAVVRVVAEMADVGDGLPARSDVRYHGLVVGAVTSVTPAAHGRPNLVKIDLQPEYASEISAGVTARAVPSNIFAVSSVQLVDRNPGGPTIKDGARIPEDKELPTIMFQTTLNKLRDIITVAGRNPRDDNTIGIMAALNAATEHRRGELLASGARLDRIMDQLNAIVATHPDGTTVSALVDAARALQQSAPDLLDALHQAVPPMQVLAQQRAELNTLIGSGMTTMGTVETAFNNHIDQLVTITKQLTPVVGELANTAHNFGPGFVKLNQLSDKFFDNMWMSAKDTANMRVNLSFTPSYSYTRADCPQYSGLKGPSCYTAPLIAVRPDIPEDLLPQNYHPPANLAPPRGTVLGPDGNLVAVGPPLIGYGSNLTDPNPPLPPGNPPGGGDSTHPGPWDWSAYPAPPVPGSANPGNLPLTPPPVPPLSPPAPVAEPGYPDAPAPVPHPPPGSGPPPAAAGPASFGGNVGPVGSAAERFQISIATGQHATVATQLLLGPLVRGMTVSLAGPPSGARPR